MASEKRSGGGGKSTKGSKLGGDRPRIHSSHSTRGTSGEGRPALPKPKRTAKPGSPAARRPVRPKLTTTADAPRPKKSRTPGAAAVPGSGSLASDDARAIAIQIAIAAIEKKAVGLEVLDVAGKVDYADFLVLMSGRSDRQVVALAQGIEDALRKINKRALSIEGLPHASWVLMDFGDVVVHVFQDEARSLYDIDGLWMDASRIPVPIPEDIR